MIKHLRTVGLVLAALIFATAGLRGAFGVAWDAAATAAGVFVGLWVLVEALNVLSRRWLALWESHRR